MDLERQLLAGLEQRVLHPDVVDYTLAYFEEQLTKTLKARSQDNADLHRQAADLERRIANQLRGLSDGYSQAITDKIANLEGQLAAVRERAAASNPTAFKLQMRDTRRFVTSRLKDLSALWNGEAQIAREEIAKHVRKITPTPIVRTYVATGIWDWLGVPERAAAMVVPGARIAPRVRSHSVCH